MSNLYAMMHIKNKIRLFIRKVFPKKRVLRTVKLRKEASDRDYYRVFLSGDSTCVAMFLLNPHQDLSLIQRILEATEVFSYYKIRVPSIYAVNEEKNLLVVKDAGVLSLEAHYEKYGQKKNIQIYKQILDFLLQMRSLPIPEGLKMKFPFITRFTESKFKEEFGFFLKYSGLENTLRSHQIKTLEALFHQISTSLCEEPYVLTHRDLHSRNIFILRGEVILLDHQDARMGPYLYDMVSLIKDSYVDLSHKTEMELVSYYLNRYQEMSGKKISMDSFFKSYYLCLFQRSVKAAGTFFYQDQVKKNRKFRQYIRIVLGYALMAAGKLNLDGEILKQLEQSFNPLMSL
ncbi:MAG: phosphotransferase [Candidatus Aureabacteria bacterium]|nr:phosphotransferase [Candidatus Auribacterota bacterium]